ncbi:antitoxin Xre/MbcA/ParS toxin-binding domain-containing protein [Variovorax sp. HJSM1_2]|uniref:antitoxin Xre/MbcA/ParS toxin-binding domain-containing protein n=1 Tax=Variovorax sp. HJSM1_2 TaxID=3366263 RepID=UPI003BD41150
MLRGSSCVEKADFWAMPRARGRHLLIDSRRNLLDLVLQVNQSSGLTLFHAVEAGVPARLIEVFADATRMPVSTVMRLVGISRTAFLRRREACEPLPDVAGHRAMSLLRIAATLHRLLDECGDPQQSATFDEFAWLAKWIQQSLAELEGQTPGDMLRNPEGLRVVESLLERTRGGLAA